MTAKDVIHAYYTKETLKSEDWLIETQGDVTIVSAYSRIEGIFIKDLFIYSEECMYPQLRMIGDEALSHGLAVVGKPYLNFQSIVSFCFDNDYRIKSIYLEYPKIIMEVDLQ